MPVPAGYQPGIGVVDTVSSRVDSPLVGIGVLGPLTIDGLGAGANRLGPPRPDRAGGPGGRR